MGTYIAHPTTVNHNRINLVYLLAYTTLKSNACIVRKIVD